MVEDFEKLNMGDSQVLKQLINNETDSPQTSIFNLIKEQQLRSGNGSVNGNSAKK